MSFAMMRRSARLARWSGILLILLCASRAHAQTMALAWDSDGVNVTGFTVSVDSQTAVSLAPSVRSWSLPTLAAGVHTFALGACNGPACSYAPVVSYTVQAPAPTPDPTPVPPAPTPCTYTVTPIGVTLDRRGGTGYVSVTTQAGCAWTASSDAGWVYVSPTGGIGSASVMYQAKSNNGKPQKTAHLAIATQIVTLTVQGK